MTVLVTGASGHVGANLTRALVASGRRVRALVHHSAESLDGVDVERVQGSITDYPSLLKATRGAEVVYHLAAVISITGRDEPALTSVNVQGTANVVRACLEAGVRRLVHCSSSHALSEFPHETPIDETRPLADGPRHLPYDRSKAGGEKEVQKGIAQGLDAVIINPVGIIGPHDYAPSPMGRVLLDLARRKFPALVDGGYCFVDVRDVCDAAQAAETRGVTGERYLLSAQYLPVPELGAIAADVTGVPAPRFVSPMWLARIGAPFSLAAAQLLGRAPRFTPASLQTLRSNPAIRTDKAQQALGFSPRPMRDTVADTYAWFRSTGRL